MKPEHEAILLANAIVTQDLAERGELVVSNHLVRMENSIRELSAEVNEAEKDYALLELIANEYEEGRDRNAELWERVKAERDRLAGENAKLREMLEAAIKQRKEGE